MTDQSITINHLSRVEGEATFQLSFDAHSGAPLVALEIFEPPRFFEGFLVGRSYSEIGDIVARICGLCPVSHTLCALQAIEQAMGVEVSEQTKRLRQLMSMSQLVSSHLVHLYALALPDYLGSKKISELLELSGASVARLLEMKTAANELTAAIGGRAIHPVAAVVGGFTKIPDSKKLDTLRETLFNIKPLAQETLSLFSSLKYPDFENPKEYVSVESGYLISNNGLRLDPQDYRTEFIETETGYAMAKKSSMTSRPVLFATGALARINNAFQSNGYIRSIAAEIGLNLPSDNPFHNNIAQAIEIITGINECVDLLSEFELKADDAQVRVSSGVGACVFEAPRGVLYHYYEINNRGLIEKADIVTPTAHNFAAIEDDLLHLAATFRGMPHLTLKRDCGELIRAYDPCFSCSVH